MLLVVVCNSVYVVCCLLRGRCCFGVCVVFIYVVCCVCCLRCVVRYCLRSLFVGCCLLVVVWCSVVDVSCWLVFRVSCSCFVSCPLRLVSCVLRVVSCLLLIVAS